MDSRALRDALGCFATGIAVATTSAKDGSPVGVTINSFSSVSLDPPLVLFSLSHSATSLSAFRAGPRYAINILAADQAGLSQRFAGAPDRWEGVDYDVPDHGCPVLAGVLAHLVCAVETIIPGGDHDIFLGRVESLEWCAEGAPLLYFRGAYRRLDMPEKADMPW